MSKSRKKYLNIRRKWYIANIKVFYYRISVLLSFSVSELPKQPDCIRQALYLSLPFLLKSYIVWPETFLREK